ncbi:bifunctional adenosylcobinamide kinase/adenosylcobinamide-phosphate guanylyltransferase, partial [Chloroflexota bacterium]
LETTAHIGRQIIDSGGMAQTIVIDCVTLLVNNILLEYSDITGEQVDEATAEKAVLSEIEELIATINKTRAIFIIVSNEVGLGLVPPNKMSRVYRDLLGRANQLLASHADEVYWMVAGIPVRIKPTDSPSNILRE